MRRRTTIEIDEDLLARARTALGARTTRATVEAALRQVAGTAEAARDERRARQRSYLAHLAALADLEVLGSEEMWR
jgi:Arc/MetJ family transcription regulator